MIAVQHKNQGNFNQCYNELKLICEEHEGTNKDHPVQWETLADFTEDLESAIVIYDKALLKADAIDSKDFQSSIGFSVASLALELGDKAAAIAYLSKAKVSCKKIVDHDLKAEINDLLLQLTQ